MAKVFAWRVSGFRVVDDLARGCGYGEVFAVGMRMSEESEDLLAELREKAVRKLMKAGFSRRKAEAFWEQTLEKARKGELGGDG